MKKFNLFNHSKKTYEGPDRALVVIVSILIVLGLIMLFSASVAVGLERFGDSAFFIKRQLFALAIGLMALFAAYRIDYHQWQKWSLVMLVGSIVLLVLVLIPGVGVSGQGAQRWINLGLFSFQPSELVKLTLILYMSAWISERGEWLIKDIKAGLVPFVILMGTIGFLILQQPDLGSFLLIALIGGVLFFVGGADVRHILSLIGAGAVMVGVAIKTAPYRLDRLLAFMNPSADPQGTGYHITQALLAVGSGGLFGLGLGHSRQKFFYLPEVVGDSLFAVIAEELGFFFSVALIAVFVFFFLRSIAISRSSPDMFGKLAAVGIAIWIAAQAFVNIAAMLNVLPLTGLPLPLMSYGGSSLIITLAGIGILLNIDKQRT